MRIGFIGRFFPAYFLFFLAGGLVIDPVGGKFFILFLGGKKRDRSGGGRWMTGIMILFGRDEVLANELQGYVGY